MEKNPTEWLRVMPEELIRPGILHIWRASLDLPSDQLNALRHTLSVDELERAGRFHFEADRNRFVAARGILRKVLSFYVAKPPDGIKFHYTPKGKPVLAEGAGNMTIEFNLSHSGGLALFAIAKGSRVGVDLEKIRYDLDLTEIARRFFSVAERDLLARSEPEDAAACFFRIWTRKEALLKAIGEGLSFPPERLDVSAMKENGGYEMAIAGNDEKDHLLYLQDLNAAPGYVAAVAIEGRSCTLRCIDFVL